MKKKLLSLVLAILLATSLSLSALATSSFNKSVFDGAADISTKSDDMSGSFSAYSTSLIGAKSNISTV